MASGAVPPARVFKTKTFTRLAAKAGVRDAELCAAIPQVMAGQADDLGGGVYKKRLGKNLYRAILLSRAGDHWIFEYLFAKQNRPNIEIDELIEYRRVARFYGALAASQFEALVVNGHLKEICNATKKKIQEPCLQSNS
jgi:hypothetical protein